MRIELSPYEVVLLREMTDGAVSSGQQAGSSKAQSAERPVKHTCCSHSRRLNPVPVSCCLCGKRKSPGVRK